jgi:hypothetical protein
MTLLGAHIARLQADPVRLGLGEGDLANPLQGASAGAGASVWTSRRGSGRERERLTGGERRSELGRSVAGYASSPSGSSPASSAGSLTVPVLTLSANARKVPTSAGERRKCSTQTPCSPAARAQVASASRR